MLMHLSHQPTSKSYTCSQPYLKNIVLEKMWKVRNMLFGVFDTFSHKHFFPLQSSNDEKEVKSHSHSGVHLNSEPLWFVLIFVSWRFATIMLKNWASYPKIVTFQNSYTNLCMVGVITVLEIDRSKGISRACLCVLLDRPFLILSPVCRLADIIYPRMVTN